jgi:hypothetical protein
MKIKSSPWGSVQHQHEIAPGIISVSTAGHGGIWLSPERQAQLPAWALEISSSYCEKPTWWEEDCEAMVIAYVFWEELKRYYPAAITKEKLAKYIQQFGYLNFPQAA